MAKPQTRLINLNNRATFRPETVGLGKFIENKGVWITDLQGATKLLVRETDPIEGLKLLRVAREGVLNCGSKTPLVLLDDGAFVAVALIDVIEPWDDDIVIKNENGRVIASFPGDEYPDSDLVMEELMKAVDSAHTRRPHRIDWVKLKKIDDEDLTPEDEAGTDAKADTTVKAEAEASKPAPVEPDSKGKADSKTQKQASLKAAS